MDIAVLSAFLYYGYVPDSSIKDLDSWLPYSAEKILELKRNWQSSTFEELVEYGSHLLQQIISAKSSKKNIVPLSGGLDSRAILGLLLQNYSSRDIKTITCGVPGTWDFDIGIQIAEEYNLESKKN